MIRLEKFAIAKLPYAVKRDSFTLDTYVTHEGAVRARAEVGAVWFRRRKGATAASIGTIYQYYGQPFPDLDRLLATWDSRYGAVCEGRWDGVGYWGSEIARIREEHMAVLVPMLEAFPELPAGHDGWFSAKGGAA